MSNIRFCLLSIVVNGVSWSICNECCSIIIKTFIPWRHVHCVGKCLVSLPLNHGYSFLVAALQKTNFKVPHLSGDFLCNYFFIQYLSQNRDSSSYLVYVPGHNSCSQPSKSIKNIKTTSGCFPFHTCHLKHINLPIPEPPPVTRTTCPDTSFCCQARGMQSITSLTRK